ncbi:2,3-bisphosphoglycerate-independent phosphoglycerate mutase [bacterium]|nr:MAG: 2,3-bisphosphoglycerate-independent phosphoglycerate mutase [bacterium]
MAKTYKKIVLVVLDGFGVATYSHGNAVALANPEAMNDMIAHYPSLTLLASGPVVGLPWGEVGNSEVGHLNMGAGRVVSQDLPRINAAISNHSFLSNEVFLQAIEHAKKYNSKLHLVGLVSDGGVHSSSEHLYALLGIAAEQNFKEVYIHMITDGRDTGPKVALDSIAKLKERIAREGVGKIATIAGRFYAMDRGQHWDQTESAYRAMVKGSGAAADSPEDAVLNNYNQNIFDEMIPPTVIVSRGDDGSIKPTAVVSANDAVIFFNFRSDRALQLTTAFVQPDQMNIEKKHPQIENLYFATMTEYFKGLPVHIAFAPDNVKNSLAEVLAANKIRQYHIAESEKYAHVTSFFNGGISSPYPNEERTIVQSPINDKNYVDRPQMSGIELVDKLVQKIEKEDYQFYLANFANSDMVGHTGNLDAAVKAVQYLDRFLEQIRRAVLNVDGLLIISADHGNIEEMIDRKTGGINTEHTTSPVPFIAVAKDLMFAQAKNRNYLSLSSMMPSGVVSDIAPTILEFFGITKPPEMNAVSLVEQIRG